MISNAVIQNAIIQKLKTNAPLIAALAAANPLSGAVEIREMSWQGNDFVYPNIRVGEIRQVPDACRFVDSNLMFGVAAYADKDSSELASQLIALVNTCLYGHQIMLPTVKFWWITSLGLLGPFRSKPLVWRADDSYKARIN